MVIVGLVMGRVSVREMEAGKGRLGGEEGFVT